MWMRTLSIVSFLTIVIGSTYAQSGFTSGLYRIVFGRYTECCGIAGPFTYTLPNENQTFVELTVDSGSRARMKLLAEDGHTVFQTYWRPAGGFTFSFSNGMVLGDSIQFVMLTSSPTPSYSYTVSNTADGLLIHGVANVPCVGCADIPTQFKHTNMVAVRVADTALVIDRIERGDGSLHFHFAGDPPNDYTVEYSDSLRVPNWRPLETFRAKLTTINITVTNAFTNASARFFRLRKEPCNCD
jgi:hypothetical protein